MSPLHLSSLLLLAACNNQSSSSNAPSNNAQDSNQPAAEEPILVRTADLKKQDIEKFIDAVANTESLNKVDVLPERTEPVLSILAEEGDIVKAGQILAELRKDVAKLALADAKVQLTKAQNEVEKAKKDYQRNLKLSEKEGRASLLSERDLEASHQTLLTALTAVESAQVGADRATLELSHCTLRAPISGTITSREISAGDMTTTGMRAFEIVDLSKPRLVFYRPQRELSSLTANQEIIGHSEALPGSTLKGNIERIAPVIDTTSGTIKVTALLNDQWAGLPTGILVRLRVILETHKDAILIPKKAILNDTNGSAFFVIMPDNKVKKVPLISGFENANYIEATETNLQGNEKVVVVGIDRIKDGDVVKIAED